MSSEMQSSESHEQPAELHEQESLEQQGPPPQARLDEPEEVDEQERPLQMTPPQATVEPQRTPPQALEDDVNDMQRIPSFSVDQLVTIQVAIIGVTAASIFGMYTLYSQRNFDCKTWIEILLMVMLGVILSLSAIGVMLGIFRPRAQRCAAHCMTWISLTSIVILLSIFGILLFQIRIESSAVWLIKVVASLYLILLLVLYVYVCGSYLRIAQLHTRISHTDYPSGE